jgi:hypothetical protein
MTAPGTPQSLLSEAVEQAARAGSMWWNDLTRFAEDQADRLASGHYGLTDLITAEVRLMRIWTQNSMNGLKTTIDNVAMLSYDGPTGGPAPRTVQVSVPVPALVNVVFQVSDLVGGGGYRIPSTKLQLDPHNFPAQPAPAAALVTVTADCAGAPADTYAGTIFTEDGSVTADFRIAVDELGVPLP